MTTLCDAEETDFGVPDDYRGVRQCRWCVVERDLAAAPMHEVDAESNCGAATGHFGAADYGFGAVVIKTEAAAVG